MTLLEAIDIRCSRRIYRTEPMDEKTVKATQSSVKRSAKTACAIVRCCLKALRETMAACCREGGVSVEFIMNSGAAFQRLRRS